MFQEYADMLICPITPKGIPSKERRAREIWTNELDQLAENRTAAYWRFKRTQRDEDKIMLRDINRTLKYKVKKSRRDSFSKFVDELDNAKYGEAVSKISNIAKVSCGNAQWNVSTPDADVDLAKLTNYMVNKFPPKHCDRRIREEKFELDEGFENLIRTALIRVPNQKSVGWVQPKIREDLNAACIISPWRACGRISPTPQQWHRMLLYPIYKAGNRAEPANCRPTVLLSHVRKVVKRAIDLKARSETRCHYFQCAFQQGL